MLLIWGLRIFRLGTICVRKSTMAPRSIKTVRTMAKPFFSCEEGHFKATYVNWKGFCSNFSTLKKTISRENSKTKIRFYGNKPFLQPLTRENFFEKAGGHWMFKAEGSNHDSRFRIGEILQLWWWALRLHVFPVTFGQCTVAMHCKRFNGTVEGTCCLLYVLVVLGESCSRVPLGYGALVNGQKQKSPFGCLLVKAKVQPGSVYEFSLLAPTVKRIRTAP